MTYTLHISDPDTGGQLLNVPSAFCDQLSIAWDTHGSADLSATLRLGKRAAFALYDRPGTPRVTASYAGGPIWAGRLERPRISGETIELLAKGYWHALDDVPYSALWSTQDSKHWYVLDSSISASYVPDMYNLENDNMLRYSLKKNAAYTSGATIATFYCTTPAGTSATNVKRFLGSYDVKLPVGWTFDVQWQTAASSTNPFGASGVPNSLIHSGTGAAVSSTFDFSPAGTITTILLRVYNNSGATYTNTTEDGNYYVRAFNLRVQGSANPQVRLSDIASGVATYIAGVNPTQIAGPGIVFSTAFDQYEAWYEDTAMAETLADLAERESHLIGVDANRRLYLWPVGTHARDWAIDAAIEAERDLANIYNQNYATYTNAAGRILRTDVNTDAGAVLRWGLNRRQVIDSEGSSATAATTFATTQLPETANPAPATRISVARVMTAQGATAPWHSILPGDTVTIRNLPPTAGTLDNIRTFRAARVQLDLEHGEQPSLSIESNTPLPGIENLLAQVLGGRILL